MAFEIMEAVQLIDEIKQNTPFGRLLGSATVTSKVLGVEQVPAVKGHNVCI
jgi:hypothetical protein